MQHSWNDTAFEKTADCLKALAQPMRLSIVCLLADGELTVGEIGAELGTSQPNITAHLIVLHNRKILKSRKEATRVYYAIADPKLINVIGALKEIYCP